MRRDAHSGSFVLHNDGQATAFDVRVSATTHPEDDQDAAAFVFHRVQPLQHLAPGTTNEQLLVTFDGIPDRYRVRVNWTNPDGTPGDWRSDLSFLG